MDFRLPEELRLFTETLLRSVENESIPLEGTAQKDGRLKDDIQAASRAGGVAERCLELVATRTRGGVGLTPDLPIEQCRRDQRCILMTEAPADVLRAQVARHVLKTYAGAPRR